jgi:hypothetical protein
MTTLADDLVPDELWALVEPLAAGPAAPALRRPAPCHPRSQLLRRDHLYGPHLDTVAAPASPTARLRLAGDLLAPPHRMGQRRRVRPTPPGGLGPPWPARPGGLVTGERGHHERAGQAWGDHGGANPVDRGKPGSKLHLVCDATGLPLTAASPPPTSTTPPCSRRSWRTSRRCGPRQGGGAPGPSSCTQTRAMTAAPTVPGCGGVGSGHGSPGVGWSPRPGLAATAGGSSGRCHG